MKTLAILPSIVPVALLLAPIRCEALTGAPPAPQVQVEDSAGILIVENRESAGGVTARVADRIGAGGLDR